MPIPTAMQAVFPRLLFAAGLLLLVANTASAQKYALLVGVERYEPPLTPLKYAEEDATEMAAALESLGFKVMLMTRHAEVPSLSPNTPQKIVRQLSRRLRDLAEEDTVIVALSGHGVQFKRPQKLADGTQETQFFCPEETDLSNPNTLLSIGQVYTLLDGCAARRKLLIVDACRNEVVAPTLAAEDRAVEEELEPAGVQPRSVPSGMLALYSCASGEKSYEYQDLGHGVFCYHVLKYLRGQAAPTYYSRNQIGLRGLADYASRETRDFVLAKRNADQFPELVGRTTDWPLARLERPIPPPEQEIPKPRSIAGTRAGEEREIKSLNLSVCWCPPGAFTMGSPASEPVRQVDDEDQAQVTLTRGYWLAKYEVTQGQWQRVMGTTLQQQRDKAKTSYALYGEGINFPMYYVSHDEATEFCQKLTQTERAAKRLSASWEYRLPTEAQWEYACRAGTATATAFGDKLSSTQANFDGNFPYNGAAKGPFLGRVTAVGSYQPNAWGLCDMHGNVYEWCRDWYTEKLPGGKDPEVTTEASYRICRGGSWVYYGEGCRSAARRRDVPGERNTNWGFRVALVQSRQ